MHRVGVRELEVAEVGSGARAPDDRANSDANGALPVSFVGIALTAESKGPPDRPCRNAEARKEGTEKVIQILFCWIYVRCDRWAEEWRRGNWEARKEKQREES